MDTVTSIPGVKESKTFMVVTTFKEGGELRYERTEGRKASDEEQSSRSTGVRPMVDNVKLKQIMDVLDQLAEDTSVPRNIRRGATDAKGGCSRPTRPWTSRQPARYSYWMSWPTTPTSLFTEGR